MIAIIGATNTKMVPLSVESQQLEEEVKNHRDISDPLVSNSQCKFSIFATYSIVLGACHQSNEHKQQRKTYAAKG